MRYMILKPQAPIHPQQLDVASLDHLYAFAPVIVEAKSEREAVSAVRKVHPGAVAMIMPAQIGVGRVCLIGLIDDDTQRRQVDIDKPIPFALLVHPMADTDADRQFMKRRPQDAFDRALWKVPPQSPDLFKAHGIELRATDLDVPGFTTAKVGHIDGKLVVYVEIGGIEMSMHFDNPALQLVELPPPDELEDTGRVAKLEPDPVPSRTRTLESVGDPPTADTPRTTAPDGRSLSLWKS